jgi:hypothetical protein
MEGHICKVMQKDMHPLVSEMSVNDSGSTSTNASANNFVMALGKLLFRVTVLARYPNGWAWLLSEGVNLSFGFHMQYSQV